MMPRGLEHLLGFRPRQSPSAVHLLPFCAHYAGYVSLQLCASFPSHAVAWLTPLSDLGAAVYRIGSNHDTLDAASEAVWREVFADIPANGPPGQEGLSYFVRRDDCLVIGLDVYATALGAPATAGGRVDVE